MASEHNGVMAAPNRCKIEARILSVTPSERFPNKRELQFELIEALPLEGPDFASHRVGKKVEGFTFDTSFELSQDELVLAEAEYLGDARQGLFQLFDLRTTES